jgi:hypothetical protein
VNRKRFFSRVALFAVATMPPVPCAIASVSGTVCDLRILASLHVEGVQIQSAIAMAGDRRHPSYCVVKGSVSTDGDRAGLGTAGFEIKLPENWNHKFLFWGSPGLAGLLPPSANAVDLDLGLSKSYAKGGDRCRTRQNRFELGAQGAAHA